MTPLEFCRWLQGYFEIETAGDDPKLNTNARLTDEQVRTIQKQLASVFEREDKEQS